MKCPYGEHECLGPADGEIRWKCPVHGAMLTRGYTRLCQSKEKHFREWDAGGGLGQHPAIVNAKPVVGKKPRKPCGGCGKPTIVSMAWDLVKSGVKFTASGAKLVDRTEYERRLSVCDGCEFRGDERVKGNEHRCGECGCYVAVKAQAVAWQCPIGKWILENQPETVR